MPVDDVPGARDGEAGDRERSFWDDHVSPLEHCLWEFERGPDPNWRAMLDAVEPLEGARVLDFACGAGVTAAFLAQRGAIVTAIDISPASIQRSREVAEHTGQPVELVAGELTATTFAPASFDAIVGRYALHHVDLGVIAPIIQSILVPGGRGAFVETMGLNPLLRFSRRTLAGRLGVASFGTVDEHPLRRDDLRLLEEHVGPVELTVGQMAFLRILDRNVLRARHRRASRALAAIDDGLLKVGLGVLSYHQVVKLRKRCGSTLGARPPTPRQS
ncbi:MAG: class I SAM-dependent methyltransferase [Solirubrobacteraceae bacterium]